MAIKAHFITSGASQAVQLMLDTDKYTASISTACGVSLTVPAGTTVYEYTSMRQAMKTGAIIRLKAQCKLTGSKKTRAAFLVCDKDKVSTARAALLPLKINIGAGVGVAYDIVKVSAG